MNNFIAVILVLPFLLFFPLQYGVQTQNHYHITQFQNAVATAKEEARQAGYFTPEIINKLKINLRESCKDLEEDEIEINVTTTPRYRKTYFDERELIEYEISIPIKRLTAANKLFGISDADNRTSYTLRGTIASERLAED